MGMRKLILLGSWVVCASSLQAQSNPSLFRCKDQSQVIQLSVNNTGQTVEGPACAEITVNAVRYSADFGKTITYSNGPILTSIFPSSFSPGGANPQRVAAQTLEEKFQADKHLLGELSASLTLLESTNRATGSKLDKYLTTLRNLIAQTDDTLVNGGPTGVLAIVNDPAAQAEMTKTLGYVASWNTTDEIVTRLQQLQADLNSLPLLYPNTGTITGKPCSPANLKLLGWSDWIQCSDGDYKFAQSSIASLLTEAAPWTSDGDKAAQFAKKIGIVQYWKTTITGLKDESSFKRQAEVRCGPLFNRNEQTVLKLILTDRTSVFDGQAPQAQIKDNLLTVTCSPPFSISAGAAFSTIRNQQFAIIKSAPSASGTTSVNTFGVTSDSRINPYPIAMAHVRLHDWAEKRYALHFSFGVGVSVKGQDSGGSNPEFLTGLSLSFLRTIYLTGGLDVGKQSQLIGGFKVGSTVPSDVTSPPVSSSYKPGFGFAITFTKP
jgi:hypothetical protein